MKPDIEYSNDEEIEVSKIIMQEDKKHRAFTIFKNKQMVDFENHLKNKLPNEFRGSLNNYNHRSYGDDRFYIDDNFYNIF